MANEAALGGIEESTLVPWLEVNVPGLRGPIEWVLIAGGRSNLTYRLRDATGGSYVLRRPPLKQVLASAHDMGREYRIIDALAATDVPVPAVLTRCDDSDVTGAPFYVMSFVEGHAVRDRATAAETLDVAARRRASESLVDVLARLHAVEPDSVGLGTLGRRDGYIARQLKRWSAQLDQATSKVPPLLRIVHDRLVAAMPEQGRASVVHGDYRLDNCLVDDEGTVVSVLDWELCTLGDPLADIGLLLVYWREADDDDLVEDVVGYPTSVPGFLSRADVAQRYSLASHQDLDDLNFYVAFGYWKLGCILQGVFDRYRDGAMADDGTDHGVFGERVRIAADQARASLDGEPL